MCLYGCASALLSGHTQEDPRLPLGPAAPAGSVAGGAPMVCSGVGRVPWLPSSVRSRP